MKPSRLKFTIKLLKVVILSKNNFFLTFCHSESVSASVWISSFLFSVHVKILMVFLSSYVTPSEDFCNNMLCGVLKMVYMGHYKYCNHRRKVKKINVLKYCVLAQFSNVLYIFKHIQFLTPLHFRGILYYIYMYYYTTVGLHIINCCS